MRSRSICVKPVFTLAMVLLLTISFNVCNFAQNSNVMVTVTSYPLWTDSGISLSSSDVVTIYGETGAWTYDVNAGFFGPDGASFPYTGDEWIADGQQAQLIGYVGSDPYSVSQNDSGLFQIGSSQVQLTGKSGELWFGCNDDMVSGNTSDNAGSLQVQVSVVSGIVLTDLNDGSTIEDGGEAVITGDSPPAMPKLSAELTSPPNGAAISWTFDLNFVRPNNNPPIAGDQLHLTGSGPKWALYTKFKNVFLGGQATLTCTVGNNTPQTIHFDIVGQNPLQSTVLSYADSLILRSVRGVPVQDIQDCFHRILRQESLQHQLVQFDANPNGGTGDPVVSFDNGVGISQVTKNDNQGHSMFSASAFWNWQANLMLGWQQLQSKLKTGYGYPAQLRGSANYHNFIKQVVNPKRQSNGLKPISGFPVPPFTDGGMIGEQPPNQLLEDAVRGYNGYAGSTELGGITIFGSFLHEFVPDENYLETLPSSALKNLGNDPNFWRRVDPSERPPNIGDPDYVENVIAQPSN